MDLGLKDLVALVPASSRGLGRAAARALAQEGARLALCARSEKIQETADALRAETGAQILARQADLTDPEAIQNYVAAAVEEFGRVDILIINAGGPPPGDFLDVSEAGWSSAFQLTIMSAVRLCRAVVPLMLEQGSGSIVTSQSYSVKQPIDHLVLSNTLRLGVIGLMKSLANEFGPRGIRVNSINPAWIWTERVEQLMKDRAQRSGTDVEHESGGVVADIPLGRMGSVEEFGRTIAWLASPAASFIHGHALMFDGGAVKAAL
jgi:3-oxoacyl-[acyl-carrier protein] reductase